MTKEQIQEFDKFLKIREMYKIYFDSLKKCPIEMAFASKDTYLPRIPSALVLSFGFYQTRNINNIKEGDWMILRNDWIRYAHTNNALDDCLQGIEPDNVISAINSIFNGKQYRGMVRTSGSVLEKIAEEAKAIQAKKAIQMKEADKEEEARLQNIIDLPAMISPEVKFSDHILETKINVAQKNYMCNGSKGEKSAIRKKCNEIITVVGTNNIDKLFDSISELIDVFEEYKNRLKEIADREGDKFNLEKQEYIEKFNEFSVQKKDAIQKLLDLHKKNEIEQAPIQKEEPIHESSQDQVVALNIKKNSQSSRVKVGDKQIYMVHKRVITTFGKFINDKINERDLDRFELVLSGGNLCLRINRTADNLLYIRNHGRSNTPTIFSKDLIEHVRLFYKVTYDKLLLNVEVLCSPESVICKFLSVQDADK